MSEWRKTPHGQFSEARSPCPRARSISRTQDLGSPPRQPASLPSQTRELSAQRPQFPKQNGVRNARRELKKLVAGERRKCGVGRVCVSSPTFSSRLLSRRRPSGAEGIRTLDPRLAKPMLSQLSYGPWEGPCQPVGGNRSGTRPVDRISEVGARRVELRTSSLSATRSNQLSYAPSPQKRSGRPETAHCRFPRPTVKRGTNRACRGDRFCPIVIGSRMPGRCRNLPETLPRGPRDARM